MVKRFIFILFPLLLIAGLYVFRVPLTLWWLAPHAQNAGLEIACLKWRPSGWNVIRVERLCVRHRGGTAEFEDITLSRQEAVVARADIYPAPSDDANSPLEQLSLSLPEARPLLQVRHVALYLPGVETPLRLSLKESEPHHFRVSGDVDTDLRVTPEQISGILRLEDNRASPLLQTFPLSLGDLDMTAHWRFNGLEANAQIDLRGKISLPFSGCSLQLASGGSALLRYEPASGRAELDLSGSENRLKGVKACLSADVGKPLAAIGVNVPDEASLAFSAPLVFSRGNLEFNGVALAAEGLNFRINELAFTPKTGKGNLAIDYFAQQSGGLQGSLSGDFALRDAFLAGNYSARAETLALGKIQFNSPRLRGSLAYNNESGLEADGQLVISEVGHDGARLRQAEVGFQLSRPTSGNLNVRGEYKIDELSQGKLTAKAIRGSYQTGPQQVESRGKTGLSAQTRIESLKHDQLQLKGLQIQSRVALDEAFGTQHKIAWNGESITLSHSIGETAIPFTVTTNQMPSPKLQPVVKQFIPDTELLGGTLSIAVSGDLRTAAMTADVKAHDLTIGYRDYLLQGLTSRLSLGYSSAGLNLAPTKVTVNQLRAGPVIDAIEGKLQQSEKGFSLFDLTGQVFGGRFSLAELVLDNKPQRGILLLRGLDAAQLLSLEQESGIGVVARVDADLPYRFDENGFTVEQGSLTSSGPGQIRIRDSAAFDALKKQQAELGNVLSLLEELDFRQLQGEVNLARDGWLDLALSIEGRNEAAEQDVNFNYTHRENVFTLFRALRLSDEISKKMAQEYQQKE